MPLPRTDPINRPPSASRVREMMNMLSITFDNVDVTFVQVIANLAGVNLKKQNKFSKSEKIKTSPILRHVDNRQSMIRLIS